MKFSENWLRELVDLQNITHKVLIDSLSMAGLEVEGVYPVSGEFSNVVVGYVKECNKHPNADKLNICIVSDGAIDYQVVCGAPNVRAGIYVPFAKIGGHVGEIQIKSAKLRNIESDGMLCSAKELGLSDDNSGLLLLPENSPIGEDIKIFLNLDDKEIELGITPNRGDCLSVYGVARDCAAIFDTTLTRTSFEQQETLDNIALTVSILDDNACPKYLARVIKNINLTNIKTPLWMVEKLRRSGIRSIDPIVDITNFVMLELGTPMHAFDLNNIEKGIIVRKAQANEKIKLLNGNEVVLDGDTLIIADHTKPLAIAGVMGGEFSGINNNTVDIVLEAAYFDNIAQAQVASKYALHTDASARYERGVDFSKLELAIERSTQLIASIVGGQPYKTVSIVSELPTRNIIELSLDKIKKVLDIDISIHTVAKILANLEFSIKEQNQHSMLVQAPAHRFDISIEEDLVEEIARIYGYNILPISIPTATVAPKRIIDNFQITKSIKEKISTLGYYEIISYSFIDEQFNRHFDTRHNALAIQNPISVDMSVMRTSLLPSLVKTLIYNLNHQQTRGKLFEVGKRFIMQNDNIEDIRQVDTIAGVAFGKNFIESIGNREDLVSFYDVKNHLLSFLPPNVEFIKAKHDGMHPGQTANIIFEDKTIGVIGSIHPTLAHKLDITIPVIMFEIELEPILSFENPKFTNLSKFPEVKRDLAMLVDTSTEANFILKNIRNHAGANLQDISIFDVYRGKGIPDDKKSVAVRLVWQSHENTMSENEINTYLHNITTHLQTLGIQLRS